MQSTSSHDFHKIAEQRFNAAETLLRAGLTLDAQYVGGYVVECSLKALIIELMDASNGPEQLKRICSGATMHRPETLLNELRTFGVRLPPELAKRMRRFDWTTDLRYETGRRPWGETNGFMKTCVTILE